MNSNRGNKVLFTHDGPIGKDKEGNYYSIQLNERLMNRYLHLGDSVTLLIRTKLIEEEEISKSYKFSNSKIHVIPVPDFKSFTKYLVQQRKVKDIVEKAVLNHDIIMARLPSAIGSMAVQYARKHRKPLIAEVVACNWDSFWYYSMKGKLVAPYFYLKQKYITRKLSYAIYVTKYFLQSRYPTKGKSINCSNVELNHVNDVDLVKRLKKIEAQKGPLVLGTVAALNVPYKGQHHVINMIYSLKSQGVDLKYRLVGQGDPERLQKIVDKYNLNQNIEVVGPLNGDEVFSFLDEIDIYIHPSKQEGLPRAMIEAMSKGLPVIGSKTAGIPELIDSEYIFEKGDESTMAEILMRMDKNSMKQQAELNFEKSKEYEIDVLNRRRFQFYKTFLIENGLPFNKRLKEI